MTLQVIGISLNYSLVVSLRMGYPSIDGYPFYFYESSKKYSKIRKGHSKREREASVKTIQGRDKE